jgi:hypothetical protein
MGSACSRPELEPAVELVQEHRTEAGKARAEARRQAAEKQKSKNYIVVPMEPLGEEELYEKEARWFDTEKRARELAQENQELKAKLEKQSALLAQMGDLIDRAEELKDEVKSVSLRLADSQLYIETVRAELQAEPGLLERVDAAAKARLSPVAELS